MLIKLIRSPITIMTAIVVQTAERDVDTWLVNLSV